MDTQLNSSIMQTVDAVKHHPFSVEQKIIDRGADVLLGDDTPLCDDYAAHVVDERLENGGLRVSSASGRSTWLALLLACGNDYNRASRIAELDTRDGWQTVQPSLCDRTIRMREIDDAEGNPVAYLFAV